MKNEKQFKLSVEMAAMQLIVAYRVCEASNGFKTIVSRDGEEFELTFKRVYPENPSEAHLKKMK